MTTLHLDEEQLLDVLRGAISDPARAHLATCPECAAALAREAALDEVVWSAVGSQPVAPERPRARDRARVPFLWIAAGAVGAAAVTAAGYASHTGLASSAGENAVDLLGWQNIVFYIPLVVGLLLVFGAVFGVGGHDAHHEIAHDHSHGHESQHGILALLGVGRVPLTVALMIAALLFGGIGIIGNGILSSFGVAPALYGALSLAGAVVGMLTLTGPAARLVARVLPATESYPVSRHEFAGCSGTLLLPADATQGYAQVRDREGNVHNIRCRTTGAALAKGMKILVVDYDEPSQMYTIDATDL